MSIATNCKECFFAKIKDDKQTGCSLNRVEKLQFDKLDENGNFILKRFCNTYRPSEWLQSLDFETSLNPEEAALNEVCPRLGLFVRLKTEEQNAIEELEKTIESIKNLNRQVSYIVAITDKVEYNEEIWGLFLKYFGELNDFTKYHILQISENPKELIKIVDEAFIHAQNSWILTTSSGEIIQKDIIDKLHKIINLDMRQIVMVEPYDNFNGLLFPAYLFKFLNGNNTKIFNDEMVDSRAFVEKVKEAEKRGNTKSILTWEEFNAS
jgi:hypothetical protein